MTIDDLHESGYQVGHEGVEGSVPGWQELEDRPFMWPMRATYEPLVVRRPQSWILQEGWKRTGSISVHDVPSKHT